MIFRSRTCIDWLAAFAAVISVGLIGCGSTDDSTGDFISDNPGFDTTQPGSTSSASAGSGGASAPPSGESDGAAEAERAIADADIIQIKDHKLYALSQYSGLSIIDVSVKDKLKLLGRYQVSGDPFEMYLRDGIVYAMFSTWNQQVFDAASNRYTWGQSSHIEALDVTQPAAIQPIGSFNLPGEINDSRIVGDVLYAVSFENGHCWNCQATLNTTITSLAVGDPAKIGIVNQLRFSESNSNSHGWRRSVSVTPQRMYVAGVEWSGGSDKGHSTIQVIDISDPTGVLVPGATVEATGEIQSRWQMDEHEGVLRVISQPGVWSTGAMPGVQTFSVISAQNIQPLGYTELSLPKPERLRSVRFDGTRAYAITAEQKDPLFTIDLSNPATPTQVGELEMPGWVYHMEPRGDRLLALGFDNTSTEGSLHVSLFDVSNMATPTLLKRVAFGGQWSSLAEDQDRIHKAFTILDDQGLLLVPYSGFSYTQGYGGCRTYESGIQLVDFTANTLTKRGVAPAQGQARRAFVQDERLFAVSDAAVRTFNIDDRSAPAKVTDLALANHVTSSLVVGDKVVRLSADWWTNASKLDVVAAEDPESPELLGSLDLSSLSSSDDPNGCWGSNFYDAELRANGQHVYLMWPSNGGLKARLAVIDITDATRPKISGQLDIDADFFKTYTYSSSDNIVAPGERAVQAGSTLVFRRIEGSGGYGNGFGEATLRKVWLEVVDLSNPALPVHAATVELPEAVGYTPLRIEGTTVLTSHWVPLPEDATKARFYLDRIDVSDPASPEMLDPVNVPGSLVSFDADTGRLLTVDYQRLAPVETTVSGCWDKYGSAAELRFKDSNEYSGGYPELGECTGIRLSFKLVDVDGSSATLLDTSPIDDGIALSGVFVGDDRVFAQTSSAFGYWAKDGNGPSGPELMVVSGMNEGALQRASLKDNEGLSLAPRAVAGKRVIVYSFGLYSLGVVDATNLKAMKFEQKGELASYLYDVELSGDLALCSLGQSGLQVIDLGE
jgi:hypothetical protein